MPADAWLHALVRGDAEQLSALMHPEVELIDTNAERISGVGPVLHRLAADGVFAGASVCLGDTHHDGCLGVHATLTVAEVFLHVPVDDAVVSTHRLVVALSADPGVVRRIVIDADTI